MLFWASSAPCPRRSFKRGILAVVDITGQNLALSVAHQRNYPGGLDALHRAGRGQGARMAQPAPAGLRGGQPVNPDIERPG